MNSEKTKKSFVNPKNIALLYCISIFFFAQALFSYLHLGYGATFYGALTQIGTDGSLLLPLFKQHFWRSLFYYHLLPPGYILYAYGFPILFPPDGQIGIYLLHTLLGIWAICSLYAILSRLYINNILSLILITLFVLSPAFNLYQTMGWYDFPTACLLIISTWRLTRFTDLPTIKNGLVFFIVIALLCSIRSLYHVMLYYLPLIIVMLFVFKKQYKIILLSACVPFLFILSLYVKNYVLFDIFSINSYAGEPLSMITMQWNFPLQYRYDGIKRGFFSEYALCPQSNYYQKIKSDNFGYSGYYCYTVLAQKYRANYIKKLGTDYKNIAILQPLPNQSVPHRTELGNIALDIEYQKNAVQALIHYPSIYLTNLRETWRLYFVDSVSYFYENMGNIRGLPTWLPYQDSTRHFFSLMMLLPYLMFFGVCALLYSESLTLAFSAIYMAASSSILFSYRDYYADRSAQFFLVKYNLWLMLAAIFIVLLVKLLCSKKTYPSKLLISQYDRTQKIIIAFLLCNISYSTFMMNNFTGNEQQRYRFYLDGLFLILFAVLLQSLRNKIITCRKKIT